MQVTSALWASAAPLLTRSFPHPRCLLCGLLFFKGTVGHLARSLALSLSPCGQRESLGLTELECLSGSSYHANIMRGPHGPAEEVPQDLLFGPHRVPGLIAGEDGAYLHTPPLVPRPLECHTQVLAVAMGSRFQ